MVSHREKKTTTTDQDYFVEKYHRMHKKSFKIRAVRYTHVIINIISKKKKKMHIDGEVDGELSKTIKCNAHIKCLNGYKLRNWPELNTSFAH